MRKPNKPDWFQLLISALGLVTTLVTLWTTLHT